MIFVKIKGKDSRGISSHHEGGGESPKISFLKCLVWAHISYLWSSPLVPPLEIGLKTAYSVKRT